MADCHSDIRNFGGFESKNKNFPINVRIVDTSKSGAERCLFGVFLVNKLMRKSKFSKRMG
jgi:hypothetical protein